MVQELAVADRSRPAQARIAVAVIFFVNGAALSSWVPHIPTVQQKLGLSTGTLGLALLGIAGGSSCPCPSPGG